METITADLGAIDCAGPLMLPVEPAAETTPVEPGDERHTGGVIPRRIRGATEQLLAARGELAALAATLEERTRERDLANARVLQLENRELYQETCVKAAQATVEALRIDLATAQGEIARLRSAGVGPTLDPPLTRAEMALVVELRRPAR